MKTFAQTIDDVIHKKRITATAAAKAAGISEAYMSSLRRGLVAPPAPAATIRLARALGLDPQFMVLLGWAEKAPKECRQVARELVYAKRDSLMVGLRG